MDIMREAAKAGNTGVIHCYSYAAPMAKEYIQWDFHWNRRRAYL